MSEVLDFRQAHEGDLAFVIDSWLASYQSAHVAGMIRMSAWHSVMEPEVKAALARPGVETWVAYCPKAPAGDADLYGWLCVERGVRVYKKSRVAGRWTETMQDSPLPLVHYIYVKQPYRRSGVARGLFGHLGILPKSHFLYTCKTGIAVKLLPKYQFARWSPLTVRYPKETSDEAAPSLARGIR